MNTEQSLDNIILFVGAGGTGGGIQKPPPDMDGDPTIFFVIVSALIAALIVKWINKKK